MQPIKSVTALFRKKLSRPIVAFVSVVSGACGSGLDAQEHGNSSALVNQSGHGLSALDEGPAAAGFLDGVWALKMMLQENVNVPLVGPSLTTVTSIGRVTIAQTGPNQANLTLQFCNVITNSDGALKISFPTTFVQGFPIVATTATASAIAVGGSVSTLPVAVLAGWKAKGDPATEALPVSATDPRVVDGDGDGHPGLTANTNLFGSDAYIVLRHKAQLVGNVITANQITGTADGLVEMSVVGSSTGLLPTGVLSVSAASQPPTFSLIRLTGANQCTDVLAAAGGLFH